MKKLPILIAFGGLVSSAFAGGFATDSLVVVRVGTGSGALTSVGTAAFLDEFSTGGSLLQSIGLPTAVAGANRILTLSGSATSEGLIQRSANGSYLTLGGYDAALGTASVASAAGISRVIGLVDASGNVNTTTALSGSWVGNNFRSVVSPDGTSFYGSGTANPSATGGIWHIPSVGATSGTQLATTPTNVRAVDIFAGQLYFSSATGTFQGVSTMGAGLPTTSGQTATILPGFPTATGPSSYAFSLLDLSPSVAGVDTAYVADDRTSGAGGVQKWVFDGSTWTLSYTLGVGASTGARGLAVDASGANPVIYATTSEGAANRLISIVDTGASSTFTTIATAAANTAFRGLDFSPVPEPSSFAILGLGLAGLFGLRRKS